MKKVDYEINPSTLAIIGKRDGNGFAFSNVFEKEIEVTVHVRPTALVDQSCKYFGSSLKGRCEGTKEVAGITHKPPIAVDPSSGIYMFPTMSPTKDICSWLAHSHIQKFQTVKPDKTLVIFKSGFELLLDISSGSFENQLNRTAQFRHLLTARMRQAKQ